MQTFRYVRPQTLDEAIAMLAEGGGKASVLAGGTDLLVEMKGGKTKPEIVIDIKNILELNTLSDCAKGLKLGALVNICEMETNPLVKEKYGVLSQAASVLASIQVRNKATVGGNLCHATPSADMAPALLALNASVRLVGAQGSRCIALEEFFTGPGKTVLKQAEILTEIIVPPAPLNSTGIYLKLSPRRAMDLAVVGVAVVLSMDSTCTTCSAIRIGLGAVAPTPIRARNAEVILQGSNLDEAIITQAAEIAAGEASPISDIRAHAWYRTQTIRVLVKRAIFMTREQIQKKVQ